MAPYCLAGKVQVSRINKRDLMIKIIKTITTRERKNLLLSNLSKIEKVLKGKRAGKNI